MTVKELIEKLSSLDLNAQVRIQLMNGDPDGLYWKYLDDLYEDDIKVTGHTVILDISDK